MTNLNRPARVRKSYKSNSAGGLDLLYHLENNRLVSLSKETGYQALDTPEPPAGGWNRGSEVRVQQVPCGVKLFQLVATDGSIDWGITNYLAAHLNREMVMGAVQGRWQVEEFHRNFK